METRKTRKTRQTVFMVPSFDSHLMLCGHRLKRVPE